MREVLNMDEADAKSEAESIKAVVQDNTINKLARYVHKELGLFSLDCDYDINKEKCRECARRAASKKLEETN